MRRVLLAVLPLVWLMAACGPAEPVVLPPIENIELPTPGTFTVTLTGAVEAEYSGEASAVKAEATGRAVYLAGERFSANLVMPLAQTTGTFTVLPLLSAFDNAQNVSAVGGVIVDSQLEGDATLPRMFDNVADGRVTILSVEPMSGAFEFITTDSEGAQVSVRAVFNELPLETIAP